MKPSGAGVSKFFSEGHISYYTTVRGPDILRNAIVSEYVTLYQINKFFVNILYCFFITDKMASRATFCLRSVVWIPWEVKPRPPAWRDTVASVKPTGTK